MFFPNIIQQNVPEFLDCMYFSDLRNFYSLRSTENSTLKSGPPCMHLASSDFAHHRISADAAFFVFVSTAVVCAQPWPSNLIFDEFSGLLWTHRI